MTIDYIIDAGCSDNLSTLDEDHMCSIGEDSNATITEENFSNRMNDTYYYWHTLFICIIIFITSVMNIKNFKDVTSFKLSKYIKHITIYSICYIIIVVFMIIHHYYTKEVNICEFIYDCEVQNNTLIPSKMYFKLINMDCPSYMEYDYVYIKEYGNHRDQRITIDDNCGTSEFGCCRYNTQCANSLAIHDYNTWSRFSNLELYNHYIEHDNGYISSVIYKRNKEGTNCPSIEYMLLKISLITNNDNSTLFIIMIYIYVLSLIVYGLYVYIRKPTQKYSVELQDVEAVRASS